MPQKGAFKREGDRLWQWDGTAWVVPFQTGMSGTPYTGPSRVGVSLPSYGSPSGTQSPFSFGSSPSFGGSGRGQGIFGTEGSGSDTGTSSGSRSGLTDYLPFIASVLGTAGSVYGGIQSNKTRNKELEQQQRNTEVDQEIERQRLEQEKKRQEDAKLASMLNALASFR